VNKDLELKPFDLTPDPKVLIALTHTPLQPLDALCELIDNAIDSFHVAKLQGAPIEFPLVVVELPGVAAHSTLEVVGSSATVPSRIALFRPKRM
jgi:hypothetical protein